MAQYVVIHTTTRIVRKITTDPTIGLAIDETIIGPFTQVLDLAKPVGVIGWKLDNLNNMVPCTLQEFRDAGMDEEFNRSEQEKRYQAFKQAIINLRDDANIPNSVKLFAKTYLELLR